MSGEDQVLVDTSGGQVVVSVLPCGIVVRACDTRSALDEVLLRMSRVRAEYADHFDASGQQSPEFWRDLEYEATQKLTSLEEDMRMVPASGSVPERPRGLTGADYSQKSIILPMLLATLAPWFIVAVLLVIVLAPIASTVSEMRAVEADLRNVAKGDVGDIGNRGATWLIRVGDTVSNVTPQRREQLREATRKIVDFLAPMVTEVRPLFSAPAASLTGQERAPIRNIGPNLGSRVSPSAGGSRDKPAAGAAPESR